MIDAFIKLLAFQAVGEIAVALTGLPVPGPLVGMALLFLYLVITGREEDESTPLNQLLARAFPHLNLLFVPAGVGITVHFHALAAYWIPIAICLIAGTVVTILITALSMRLAGNGN